jgi:hypothetical protein
MCYYGQCFYVQSRGAFDARLLLSRLYRTSFLDFMTTILDFMTTILDFIWLVSLTLYDYYPRLYMTSFLHLILVS